MFSSCLRLHCDSFLGGSGLLRPSPLQQQSCGPQAKETPCHLEVGKESGWAAQLSPLCPGSGMEGRGSCRRVKEEKEKMGGEQRGRERRHCKFRCFTTSQKCPESSWLGRGGLGGHKEKFKLSNGCGSLLKFMENPLSHPRKGRTPQPRCLPPSPPPSPPHSSPTLSGQEILWES